LTTILSLDTALGACSAAVVDCGDAGPDVRAGAFELRARGHAEALAPMIEAVMARAGIDFAGIDRFAVTVGPGSFTGLRVGIATARGLALAAKRPLIGLSTLEAIAANVPDGGRRTVVVAIDARRDELYMEVFGPGRASLTGPRLVARGDAGSLVPDGPAVVVGSAAALVADMRPGLEAADASPQPDAAVFAPLAAGRPEPGAPPEPLYLRGADAKLPERMGVERLAQG
jgi:tRNA threonylcarbamoyladenosine biosynthesis protein TsaB